MPNERRRIYWDANVWLSYVNGVKDRLPVLDALLADSASPNGTTELYTSALAKVEVAFGATEQFNHALDPEIERKIDSLWLDKSVVKLVEYHDSMGAEARQLMRMAVGKGWRLKPMDAIHLSTAKWLSGTLAIAEFHTYDEGLLKYHEAVGFPVLLPHIQQPQLL